MVHDAIKYTATCSYILQILIDDVNYCIKKLATRRNVFF